MATARLSVQGADPYLSRLLATITTDGRAAAGAVAEHLEFVLGTDVAVVEKDDGAWRHLGGSLPLPETSASPLLDDSVVTQVGGGPVAVLGAEAFDQPMVDTIRQACAWVALHLAADVAGSAADDAAREARVVRAVSEQMRSVDDLDQVLHSIATRTLDLLGADICGVLLRHEEELVMTACVGHTMADTACLRMARGQGVAGKVFETGRPSKIDDYLADHTISSDFMSLAAQEATRSALAVPLTLRGDLIGVLEVWRRRASVFTSQEVQRLVTLADFASIAIDKARLYDQQQVMLRDLAEARVELEHKVEVFSRTASVQEAVDRLVLGGATYAAIAAAVHDELGGVVAVYGPEGANVALRPHGARVPATYSCRSGAGAHRPEGNGWAHPIVADQEYVGSVLLLDSQVHDDVVAVAVSQVAMACALTHLQQQASSRARDEALEQSLWDLLQGPIEHRMAARSRVRRLGIDLEGPLQVVRAQIIGLASHASNTAAVDRMTHEIVRAIRTSPATPRHTLVGLRGDQLVAVVPAHDAAGIRDLIGQWGRAALAVGEGVGLSWGVSRAKTDPFALAAASDEAVTALTAALRLESETVALFDELGIVRLLLGRDSDPDMRRFLDEVTGPLLSYDREQGGALVATLRAYFDANCSPEGRGGAAVHPPQDDALPTGARATTDRPRPEPPRRPAPGGHRAADSADQRGSPHAGIGASPWGFVRRLGRDGSRTWSRARLRPWRRGGR
ncbi:helix-turn-helix domain-containing protein [Ornithinicoccus hortensis]|uniref:helix-turn-helix domain-containing protein n=1 Tax=Ornithinicoccus hortensis TaxID=82346 RepID=UPI001478F70E|nr:GAF domain-containing protein [Ornithinicoccus hortensis]